MLLAAAALTPWASAPAALVAGVVFALAIGNPWPAPTRTAQTWLLQASVVGLGAAMNLSIVLRVGASGLVQTLLGITLTLGLALLLTRALKTEPTTSLLIGVGTAICGGSAIAAAAPAVGARAHQTSVALAVVFLLNSLALFVFPPVGHLATLSPAAFGLWSALAIHDTSSVVGASLQYAEEAVTLATTVKLARALWIMPLTLLLARVWPHEDERGAPPATWPASRAKGRPRRPWFIVGFVAVAALVTWVPALQPLGGSVAAASRQVLVLTLFLVGAGVSRDALRQVGWRPIALGVALWVAVATATLGAIALGLLAPPQL
ncbi:MAG: putative sulfate exporter family transporter [Myxococcaceae bacterium]|nr:putative sulfate exporter family transporter [Myxococcaceae bacterium]